MKKIICCLLVAVLSAGVVGCGNAEQTKTDISQTEGNAIEQEKSMDGVFRYANWGDSIEAVMEREEASCSLKTEDSLVYQNIKLLTHQATAIYFFDNNGFEKGYYSIEDTHTEPTLYINDFNNVHKALTEKYGQPIVNDERWTRDLFKDDPGMALYCGEVEYVSIWKMDDLIVLHGLRSDNFEISHVIFYSNPNAETKTDTSGL